MIFIYKYVTQSSKKFMLPVHSVSRRERNPSLRDSGKLVQAKETQNHKAIM